MTNEQERHLSKLIEMAKTVQMTAEQQEAQRISFAYGNAKLAGDNVTRDGIARDSKYLKGYANDSYQDIKNRAPSVIKTWQELMEGELFSAERKKVSE